MSRLAFRAAAAVVGVALLAVYLTAALFVADFTYSLIDPRAEQAGGPTGE